MSQTWRGFWRCKGRALNLVLRGLGVKSSQDARCHRDEQNLDQPLIGRRTGFNRDPPVGQAREALIYSEFQVRQGVNEKL